MQKTLLFFLLFIFNHYLHAQSSAPDNNRLIDGMVAIRDDVMRDPETDLLGLQKFLQLYGSDCNGYGWFFDS